MAEELNKALDENKILHEQIEKLSIDREKETFYFGTEIENLKETIQGLMKEISKLKNINSEILTDDEGKELNNISPSLKSEISNKQILSQRVGQANLQESGAPTAPTAPLFRDDYMKIRDLISLMEPFRGAPHQLQNYIQQIENMSLYIDPREEQKYVHLLIAGTLRGDASDQLQGLRIDKISDYTSVLQLHFGGEESLEMHRLARNEIIQERGESIQDLGKRFLLILRRIRNSINSNAEWSAEIKQQIKGDEEKATIERFMTALRNKNLFLLLKAQKYSKFPSVVEAAKALEKSVSGYDNTWGNRYEKRGNGREKERRPGTSGRQEHGTPREGDPPHRAERLDRPSFKCNRCHRFGHTERYCRQAPNFPARPNNSKDPPKTYVKKLEASSATGNHPKRESESDGENEWIESKKNVCNGYSSDTQNPQDSMYQDEEDEDAFVADYF